MAPIRPGEFERDAALPVFTLRTDRELDADERERIDRVPGFTVQNDGTVLVEASSAEVAVAWLVERLDAR
jgi:hypothetical protein